MTSVIVKIVSIVSGLLVALWAPLSYFAIPAFAQAQSVVYWASVLINFGTTVWVTYLVSNTLAIFVKPSPTLNSIDKKTSTVALWSLSLTSLAVIAQMSFGGADIWIVLQTSNALQILIMLTAYAYVDVFLLQRIADAGLINVQMDPAAQQSYGLGPLLPFYERGLRRIGPLQETVFLDVAPDGYVEPDIPAIDEARLISLAADQLRVNAQAAAGAPPAALVPQPT